jgi:uncharacterized membrane protein
MCVMEGQHEALAVTTRLTDTVYFGSPYWDSNRQPLGQTLGKSLMLEILNIFQAIKLLLFMYIVMTSKYINT